MNPPAVGQEVELEVLGAGRVTAVVERVEELVQEGVRGLAWRVTLRLPDGSAAPTASSAAGKPTMAFLDPRHRVA